MMDDLSDEAATAFAVDSTVDKPSNLKSWKKGESGNPAGRKPGSRNRLSEAFLNSLEADFEQHGPQVIAKVRVESPAVYLKVVANLMPAQLEARLQAQVDVHHQFSDTNSIADILETVAHEAGAGAAMQLAAMFGLDYDLSVRGTSGMKLLSPEEVCPFDPVTDRAEYRNWHHRRHGAFPDED
jgi:hypothetical protein